MRRGVRLGRLWHAANDCIIGGGGGGDDGDDGANSAGAAAEPRDDDGGDDGDGDTARPACRRSGPLLRHPPMSEVAHHRLLAPRPGSEQHRGDLYNSTAGQVHPLAPAPRRGRRSPSPVRQRRRAVQQSFYPCFLQARPSPPAISRQLGRGSREAAGTTARTRWSPIAPGECERNATTLDQAAALGLAETDACQRLTFSSVSGTAIFDTRMKSTATIAVMSATLYSPPAT